MTVKWQGWHLKPLNYIVYTITVLHIAKRFPNSGVASTGQGGQSVPLDSEKITKNQEKEGKNFKKLGKTGRKSRKNQEKEEK